MQDSTGHMADGPTLASGKIPLSADQIDAVLKSFAGDQTSVRTIDTAIGLKVMHISQTGTLTSATDIPPDASHLQQLGSLQGLIDTCQLQHGIDQAHDKDHVNAVKQAWLSAAFGGISAAPTPGGFGEVPFQMITGASGSAAPVFEHIWPTDGADDQIQKGGFTLSTKSGALSVPIVQGLINAHKITPPPGAPWFDPATGLVDVTGSPQAQNEFNDWLDNNGAAGLARVANSDVNTGYEQTAKSWNLK